MLAWLSVEFWVTKLCVDKLGYWFIITYVVIFVVLAVVPIGYDKIVPTTESE